MSTPTPTVGRIVRYRLTEDDAVGLGLEPGTPQPAMVTRVHEKDAGVNLLVLLDSEVATMHVTFAVEGTEHGQWQWPPRAS